MTRRLRIELDIDTEDQPLWNDAHSVAAYVIEFQAFTAADIVTAEWAGGTTSIEDAPTVSEGGRHGVLTDD